MGCEYRRVNEPLCKWFSPSSLNELLFLFVIVVFIYFCNTIQARNVLPDWRVMK